MPDQRLVSAEQVQALARVVQLDLPEDRLTSLVSSLSNYLQRAAQLRAIDVGLYEPPVITFESETEG